MKAKEIVSKIETIKQQYGQHWQEYSDIVTIEGDGYNYTFPVHQAEDLAKRLSKVNEDRPGKPGPGKKLNARSKSLQEEYASYQKTTILILKSLLKDAIRDNRHIDLDFITDILSKKQHSTNSKNFIKMKTQTNETTKANNGHISAIKQNDGLRLVKYSAKAIAVFGETKPVKDDLKALGGKFNPFLKENGKKQAGWIFSAKRREAVEAYLNN